MPTCLCDNRDEHPTSECTRAVTGEQERPVTTGSDLTEPMFFDSWYEKGIRSQETGEDGGDIGNRAYYEYLEAVISAATGGRKMDWTQVRLAVVLDRMIRMDEQRRRAADPAHGENDV